MHIESSDSLAFVSLQQFVFVYSVLFKTGLLRVVLAALEPGCPQTQETSAP